MPNDIEILVVEKKKSRIHEGLVCGYLPPYLRKKFEDYIKIKGIPKSEIVVEGIMIILEREGFISKKNH